MIFRLVRARSAVSKNIKIGTMIFRDAVKYIIRDI